VRERHRHRYEFNNRYCDPMKDAGMRFSGWSLDSKLVEIIEIPDHPWFVGCQFHPEFTSTPRDGHALFRGFIEGALAYQQRQASGAGGADQALPVAEVVAEVAVDNAKGS
jgi:CTP synthase